MRIEIDQSGRVDEAGDTIVALANDLTRSIKIPAKTKEAARLALTEKGLSPKLRNPLLWTACVFLLLKDNLKSIGKKYDAIVVDNEFDGYQRDIKATLLRFIRKSDNLFPEHKIRINSITKKSNAHKVALVIKRGKGGLKADRTIKPEEIVKLVKITQ